VANTKLGNTATLFEGTTRKATKKKARGKRAVAVAGVSPPQKHDEPHEQVTVLLFSRQVAYLDRLAVDIRGASGPKLKRAQIIRELIDTLEKSKPEPGKIKCLGDIGKTVSSSSSS